ncbi:Mu transposase C-terminal domain-containing protein [Bosea sp. ANAM02]|uniref:Mu transposase C-terminal domain-containing protein n=1 Tax=Bosea sp. ANAM02 TaxID=2020412 RepID=UPI00140F4956|nr:Mu transposase C-terminal domain-containing protein [Bosea sp. ANAM02]BCB17123.1 hypothetical protein OCUBac02_00170 [Bosea sp. ANAM02]
MTPQIRLQPGTVVKVEGVLHRVKGRNHIGLNLQTLGEMPVVVTRPHDEVARLYFARPRRFEVVETVSAKLPIGVVDNLNRQIDTFDIRYQDEAIKRLDYVRACDTFFADGTFKKVMVDYAKIAALTAEERRRRDAELKGIEPQYLPLEKVSGAALRQWHRRWCKAGRNIVALVPLNDRKGRTGFKLDPEVEKMIARRVREDWLLLEGPPLSHVILMIQDDVNEINKARVTELAIPDAMTVRRWVDANVSEFEKVFHREGKAAAEQRFRHVKAAPISTHPLEIVEIDHTWLDVLIVDEAGDEVKVGRGKKKKTARPWLTVAVCTTTRMIMGYYLTLERPSWTSVMNCLRMGILPKDLEGHQVTSTWPVFGVPQVLKLDNGKEFHSRSINAAAGQLRMELRYMPRAKPHLKGKVERLLGTVARDFCAYLPGRTFRDVRERGDYESEERAAFTLQELNDLFIIWLVDIYHNRQHGGLVGRTPLQQWNELSGMGVRLPPSADDLSPLISLVVDRTIRSTGITFLGLNYQSESLKGIRRRRGFHYGQQFLVKIDPYNVGEILVLVDEKTGWEAVPCEDPSISEGVSLTEWKDTVKLARKMTANGDRVAHQTLINAMKLLRAEAERKGAKARKLTQIDADWFRENLDAPWFDVSPDPSEPSDRGSLAKPPSRKALIKPPKMPAVGYLASGAQAGKEDEVSSLASQPNEHAVGVVIGELERSAPTAELALQGAEHRRATFSVEATARASTHRATAAPGPLADGDDDNDLDNWTAE